MTPSQRLSFHFVGVTAALGMFAASGAAQGLQGVRGPVVARPGPQGALFAKPSPSVPAEQAPASPASRSMLDQPALAARIQVNGNRLTVIATNSSLTDVIRQVAAQTGMQVEGNSRDERVFGVYGPGDPLEVVSSLLYDSGYNVMMVGSTPDGAPRRLLLSPRSTVAANATTGTQPARNGEEDEEAEQPQEQAPPPQTAPQPATQGAAPGAPPGAGAIKTPQQMLEELQKMHLGQQPQEMPRE